MCCHRRDKAALAADRTSVRHLRATSRSGCLARGLGTGVEPVTARFTVWCSPTELTSLDASLGENPSAEHTPPTASVEDGTPCAAGPAASLLQKRRRWESNPLRPGCSRLPGRLAPASSILVRSR